MDFSRILVHTAAAAAVTVAFSGAVFAADDATELKLGEMEYMSQCASCHGPEGHGDGPVAAVLKTAPPDLTMITSRYSGTFPTDQIVMMIDGTEHDQSAWRPEHAGLGRPLFHRRGRARAKRAA